LLEGSISGELLCLAKAEGNFNLGYGYIPGPSDQPGEDPDYQNGTHRFDGGVEAKLRLG
ncbi:MAG: hypothetical protein GWO24_13855, partial [Akkermansiaceae bacterium]|nr:hypothetical protein [Akkermansiaceae bacterium]